MNKGKGDFKESSLFVRFFAFLWETLKNSTFLNWIFNVPEKIAKVYTDSFLYKILTTKDIENFSDTSIFYRFLRLFCSVVEGIASFFVGNLEKSTQHGFFSGVARFLTKNSITKNSVILRPIRSIFHFFFSFEGIIAIISGAIFCIPHEMWNNVFGLLAGMLMLVLAIVAAICKKDKIKVQPTKLWLSFILFVVSILFSTVFSMDRTDSIRVLAFFLTAFLMYSAIRIVASSNEGRQRMLVVMYVVTIVTSVIGIFQRIMGVEADPSLTDLSLNADMPGRVFSTFGNPNNFAQFLVMFLPFAVILALNAKTLLGKIILLAPLSVAVISLMETYSRSGWIAFAVAAVVFVVLYDKRLIPLFVVFAIIAVPFLPETVMDRILTIGNLNDSSSSYRIIIWQGCIDMLKDWWVSGVGLGPGAFSAVYPFYSYGISSVAPHSHMQFMEILIELGVFGFLIYIWFIYELIKRSCVQSKNKDKNKASISIACASSMVGLFFLGLFEYCWFYPRVILAFFVVAAMAIQDTSKNKTN